VYTLSKRDKTVTTVKTKDYSGTELWQEVTMAEWDNLADSEREILIKSNGGLRFVKRIRR